MKKIIATVVMALTLAFCLVGCATESPTDVVKKELGQVQNASLSDLQKLVEAQGMDVGELASAGIDLSDIEKLSGPEAELVQTLVKKFCEFDYTLGEEKIDGDNATVVVNVKTYDFGKAVSSAITEYIGQAFVMAFSGASEADMQTAAIECFKKACDSLTDKTVEMSATIPLVKSDGKWTIGVLSEDTVDAFLGGLLKSLRDLQGSLNG